MYWINSAFYVRIKDKIGKLVQMDIEQNERTCEGRGNINYMNTTIQKIDARPGQRIIAMSDIHGHLDNMVQLLRKLKYSGDDILVIVGDLLQTILPAIHHEPIVVELKGE